MRLLFLDSELHSRGATKASFQGDISVFDFDAVIWDPEETFRRYTETASQYQGLPSPSENRSVQMRADSTRRRQEFLEFLEAGRSMVVFVRPPLTCYLDTGKRSYSGTGRNRVTTTHVAEFDLWSALPVDSIAPERASGSRIEVLGDGPISELFKKYKDFLTYSAVLKQAPGSAIARVAGTDRIVGSVQPTKGGGWLVLAPAMDFWIRSEDEDVLSAEAGNFQDDLIGALLELNAGAVTSRPAWAAEYATAAQRKLQEAVVSQQKKVERARARLAKLQGQEKEAEERDQLYLGTGRALEIQVREVLELLGGKVSEPEPGRDDWRVTFPEGEAVVEVKGVGKSAAEKHAAQLEKWVANAYEQTGNMPKGILVVNTWRKVPLDSRGQDDFPPQMVPYSKGRGHCLLTGLQLFLIRADVETNADRAAHWRKALFGTKGILKKPDDWRAVIQLTETEETE